MPYVNLTIPYKKKSGLYTGVSARISSAFSAAVRRRSLLRAEFFPEEGLDAARLQNGQDEITKNLALQYLAALHAGEPCPQSAPPGKAYVSLSTVVIIIHPPADA